MSATHRRCSFWQSALFGALALVFVLSQTGCSGFSSLMGQEPVTLRFVFMEGIADYESLAAGYQKDHPNVTIELVPVAVSTNPISAFVNQMDGADAVRMPVEAVSDDLTPALLSLDTMISTDRDFPEADMFPGVLGGLKIDGKQIGLPAGLNPFVVYYSPMKFNMAGLQPPAPNWTVEDFMLTATSLHDVSKPGDPRFMHGFCSRLDSAEPVIIAYMFGGGIVNDPYLPTQPTLDRQENIDSLAWYSSLKTDFGIIKETSSPSDHYRLVSGLTCGYWMDWMDRRVYMRLDEDSAAVLPLPGYKAPFGVVNLDGYFITTESEHPEETYQWLRFLMTQEAAAGGLIPPLKSGMQSAEYGNRVSPDVLAVAQSLPPQTIVLGLELYRDQRFGKMIELYLGAAISVMSGGGDANTALTEAQQRALSEFK